MASVNIDVVSVDDYVFLRQMNEVMYTKSLETYIEFLKPKMEYMFKTYGDNLFFQSCICCNLFYNDNPEICISTISDLSFTSKIFDIVVENINNMKHSKNFFTSIIATAYSEELYLKFIKTIMTNVDVGVKSKYLYELLRNSFEMLINKTIDTTYINSYILRLLNDFGSLYIEDKTNIIRKLICTFHSHINVMSILKPIILKYFQLEDIFTTILMVYENFHTLLPDKLFEIKKVVQCMLYIYGQSSMLHYITEFINYQSIFFTMNGYTQRKLINFETISIPNVGSLGISVQKFDEKNVLFFHILKNTSSSGIVHKVGTELGGNVSLLLESSIFPIFDVEQWM